MANPMSRILTVCLVSAALPVGAAMAQEMSNEEEQAPWDDVSEFAANSAFVWLEEPDETSERKAMKIDEFARQFEGSIPFDGGFLVNLAPAEARRMLEDTRTKFENDRTLPTVRLIEPNSLVHGFVSGCGDPTPLPVTEEPAGGVDRVNGPISGTPTGRVWIIDSGIAGEFDGGELNVNRADSRECNPVKCDPAGNPANTAKKDKLGHGTALAGIIGARQGNGGLVGVAPDVELVAIQIFKGNKPIVDAGTALRAVTYVADETHGAQSGDVVNISWGDTWNPHPDSLWHQVEAKLKAMAGRGVKIAVAAGNNDVLQGSGYVQTVTPARAGAYRHTLSDGTVGAIVTVSAAGSQFDQNSGTWTDIFWPDSAFGNGELVSGVYVGPPDFAEPGVGIQTLWPATGGGQGRVNTCTGTSFAAAVASGILTAGLPQRDTEVAEDPSAKKPDGTYDNDRLDRIGVH